MQDKNDIYIKGLEIHRNVVEKEQKEKKKAQCV